MKFNQYPLIVSSAEDDTLLVYQDSSSAVKQIKRKNLLGAAAYPGFLNVKSYGAKGDGVTDDTAAIQAALTAAQGTTLGVYFPDGVYIITSGLIFINGYQNKIFGTGASTIKWGGAAGAGIMLTLADCYLTTVAYLRLVSATNAIAAGIWLKNDGALSSNTPANCRLQQIEIDGVTNKIGKCVRIGGTGSFDGNNDFHYIDQCTLTNYSDAGLSIENSQAYNILLVNARIIGNGAGVYGIKTIDGPGDTGGSFTVYGGGIAGNTGADIYLGTPNSAPILIDGINSEGSAQFLKTAGPSGASFNVAIKNSRWASDAATITGNNIIHWKTAGSLTIDNCTLGDNGATFRPLTIMVENNYPTITSLQLTNSVVFSSAADIFAAQRPTVVFNSFQETSAGVRARIQSFFADEIWFKDAVVGSSTVDADPANLVVSPVRSKGGAAVTKNIVAGLGIQGGCTVDGTDPAVTGLTDRPFRVGHGATATTRNLFVWGDTARCGVMRGYHDGGGAVAWSLGGQVAAGFQQFMEVLGIMGSAGSAIWRNPGTTDIDLAAETASQVLQGGVLAKKAIGTKTFIELTEQGSDPAAPAANGARLYLKDVGGKTALFAIFNTGAAQQIAIQP